MDAWSAVFMLLYKVRKRCFWRHLIHRESTRKRVALSFLQEAYGDTSDGFINRTYTKMRNGFVHLPWNYEASGVFATNCSPSLVY